MSKTGWRQMPAPASVRAPSQGRLIKLVEEVGKDALCQNLGEPDWWTPHGSSAGVAQATGRAVMVCAACPVADQCLELAAGTGEFEHVWGQVPLSHRLDAAEAWARVKAGQPVRSEALAEALSAAATRNLEDDYGAQWLSMPRKLRAQLHAQERGRLGELVSLGRIAGQVERDVATWQASPWSDMDLVEDRFADEWADEQVEEPVQDVSASWMPDPSKSSAA